MLVTIATVLLVAWMLGVIGAYDIGDPVHILLLIGLTLLLAAAGRAREAAMRRPGGGGPEPR
jgi:hypothetical protein